MKVLLNMRRVSRMSCEWQKEISDDGAFKCFSGERSGRVHPVVLACAFTSRATQLKILPERRLLYLLRRSFSFPCSFKRIMSNIRIAIIGQGAIGPRHTDAVLNTPGTSLACIVDPHPPAAQGAAKYKCPIFTSVDAMLQDTGTDFDAAIVCTPNHTHVAISKQLLQAGKHVLCEKPICVDVASGRELV